MKDYYEEHGAPDDGDRADNTEPEEEDEEEEEETGGANKQAGGKTSAELTVQTRVCPCQPATKSDPDMLSALFLGCPDGERYQRIQVSWLRPTYALPCWHPHDNI
jgi:hypothetical protein